MVGRPHSREWWSRGSQNWVDLNKRFYYICVYTYASANAMVLVMVIGDTVDLDNVDLNKRFNYICVSTPASVMVLVMVIQLIMTMSTYPRGSTTSAPLPLPSSLHLDNVDLNNRFYICQ